MKNYINFFGEIMLVMALFSLQSCTKLENESFSTIISEQFNPTEGDVAALVGAAYIPWRQTFLDWNGVWRTQEITADGLVIPARPNGWVDGGIYKRLHQHRWTPDDDPVVQAWSRTYSGITNCNRIIYQIKSGSIPMDEFKEKTIAELRVLRASYYYLLCDIFGNVPIITDFNIPEGFLPEQNTRTEVYNFIVSEITESLPLLSEENSQSTYGRFNKWAAYTLLAKMYLNAEVYTGQPAWEECIEATNMVINSGKYQLEPNQKNVFVTHNENSSEIIFALPFDQNYVTNWNAFDLHLQTLQPSNQSTYELLNAPWGGICAIPQFIETFHPNDKRLTDNWIYGQQYSSSGELLEVSLGAYSGQPLNYVNVVPSIDESEAIHGYRLGKFEIAVGATNVLENDFPLLRYADVLLMKAESLLRLGSIDEAAQIVTKVRMRSFDNPEDAMVTGPELLEDSSYDYTLQNKDGEGTGRSDITYGRFLDELGWEFAQEGRRRQDLIRFGVFTTGSWFSHSPNGEYRSLYPIPRIELQNNSNLTQNPGY